MIDVKSATAQGPAGVVLHLISAPPSALPTVTRRDLEQAWEAAQVTGAAPPRFFRFAQAGGPPVELRLQDRDAAAWAAAVERSAGLSTPHGISICLRLLALVALMAEAEWARGWFDLRRDGADIRPELWHAAALVTLNDSGGFDETDLRALLPEQSERLRPARPG
jgi:hypothetical protein